ncbi:MAG TPA: ABC transporter permease [Candidatus Angelobacter sp.]
MWFRKRKKDEEGLDHELRFHLEKEVEQNIARGMSAEEARRRALIAFGGVQQAREKVRDVGRSRALEDLQQDLRYGWRALRKSPGFTVVAAMTLALGIGANTAIFSVVNAVLLRPLPYTRPQELVTLRGGQSWPDLSDIQQQNRSLEKLGAFAPWQFDLLGHGEPEQISAALVSLDLFDALGVPPAAGRTFSSADDQPGSARVAVVSYGFWQRKLESDPRVSGRSIILSGNSFTVIGVMPPGFQLPQGDAEIWVPFRLGYPEAAGARGVHMQYAIARLRPRVSLGQAQSELDTIVEYLATLYPEENRGRRILMLPLRERVTGNVRPALQVLFAAVGLVLLLASLNFADLLLARASTRIAEAQVRAALGATPWRLVRQFLTESILLSAIGGIVGLTLGAWGVRILLLLKPPDLPQIAAVEIDGVVLLFTLVISLLTGAIFGLFPVLRVILPTYGSGLRTGKSRSGQTRSALKLRRAVIVGELAISLTLLCGSGLLLRTLWRLQSTDSGFNPEGVLTARLWLPENRYAKIDRQNQFFSQLEDRLKQLPAVKAASLVTELPLSGNHLSHNFVIVGQPPPQTGAEPEAQTNLVSSGYFASLEIPLLQGRFFAETDRAGAPLVAIVNQTMVREFFANADPIGAQIYFARDPEQKRLTIIGVVGDVKEFGPDEDQDPAIYTHILQKQEPWRRWSGIILRSAGGQATLAEELKKAVWAVDPEIPVNKIEPLADMLADSLAARRFNTLLLSLFATTSLLLAITGVYGVISYAVTQRTQEIGVRMALGARSGSVFWLVLKQGLALTVLGIALGTLGSLAAGRALVSLLFGVGERDLVTFLSCAVLLALVVILATLLPARRAARVDPMVALRDE